MVRPRRKVEQGEKWGTLEGGTLALQALVPSVGAPTWKPRRAPASSGAQ